MSGSMDMGEFYNEMAYARYLGLDSGLMKRGDAPMTDERCAVCGRIEAEPLHRRGYKAGAYKPRGHAYTPQCATCGGSGQAIRSEGRGEYASNWYVPCPDCATVRDTLA